MERVCESALLEMLCASSQRSDCAAARSWKSDPIAIIFCSVLPQGLNRKLGLAQRHMDFLLPYMLIRVQTC